MPFEKWTFHNDQPVRGDDRKNLIAFASSAELCPGVGGDRRRWLPQYVIHCFFNIWPNAENVV